MKNGIEIIAEERKRQVSKEGFTGMHDKRHVNGELANAAALYAMTKDRKKTLKKWGQSYLSYFWTFEKAWYKPTPKNRIKELAKAGAMIAAEIDRIQDL